MKAERPVKNFTFDWFIIIKIPQKVINNFNMSLSKYLLAGAGLALGNLIFQSLVAGAAYYLS